MILSADDDPFDTAALRTAVLDAWIASPSRFREDANAEERLAASYAPRVIAELAANGADAARAAGIRGEIALWMGGDELRVANTGAPLDAPGVAALAALRASAKRDTEAVGRFGVGFTAVRALSDEPAVVSTSGGVRFSAAATERAVVDRAQADARRGPTLAAELERRSGVLPILRLPWPLAGERPADGFATEVRLPLRDGIDSAELAASLTVDLASDLLWALPDLVAVTVPGFRTERVEIEPAEPGGVDIDGGAAATAVLLRVTAADGTVREYRHHVVVREGTLPGELLDDRPVEERGRTGWRIAWIAPTADSAATAATPDLLGGARAAAPGTVVGAPTATDERIAVPARLIATVPVDEARGTITPGPLTDYMVDRAADAYVDLVRGIPIGQRLMVLPASTFPLGRFDAALREAIRTRLATADVLVDAAGRPTAPDRIVMVEGIGEMSARRIADLLPGLIGWPERIDDLTALRSLGARTEPVSVITAALAGIDRPAEFWRAVYDGLAEIPADDLADLPVPRRDGGTIIGPRGVLLPLRDRNWADRAAALVPGLRLAADDVDHRLLRRLGAVPADPGRILADPLLAAEIDRRYDEADPPEDTLEFAELIADLVAAGGGSAPALGRVLLTDSDGEICPAGELLLPDAPLADVLEGDWPTIAGRWIDRYPIEVLRGMGVRFGFATALADLDDLPDAEDWPAPPGVDRDITAILDLDSVAPDRWRAALDLVAADPVAADCLRGSADGPSYSAWWIGQRARIDGEPPSCYRLESARELDGIYDVFPGVVPPHLLAEIGVLGSLADAAAHPEELLRRWADPSRRIAPWQVPDVTAALLGAPGLVDLELASGVRVLSGDVVDAESAAVLDHPMLIQVCPAGELVPGGVDPTRVAEILDLPLASQVHLLVTPAHHAPGRLGDIDGAARALAAAGRPDLADTPAVVDAQLSVRRHRSDAVGTRVTWWIDGDCVLTDGTAGGVGRAVAHLAGCWSQRFRLVAAALGDDSGLAEWGLD